MAPQPRQLLAYFATCPKGLESLLLEEIRALGAVDSRETVAGVYFSGDLALGYRCCLWSRLANRVLLTIADAPCPSTEALYEHAAAIDWDQHLTLDRSFAVTFSGRLKGINHSHFGALRVKDAVVDYFNRRHNRRPNVSPTHPDVPINVRVAKGRMTVSIDLAGDSLHRRGYRQEGGSAPLKENLAAAILLRADWPAVASRGGALLDPMCGSGTLLVEGAWMAANIAPGILRRYWGFLGWKGHQPDRWRELLNQAQAARAAAMQREWPEIRGYDGSSRAVELAQQSIDRAGLNGKVRVLRKELAQFRKPTHTAIDDGLIITNPPYGERLGDSDALVHLYRHLGQVARTEFEGWQMGVFTGNPDLGKTMGLRSVRQYQLFNGAIPSKLLMFSIVPDYYVNAPAPVNPVAAPAADRAEATAPPERVEGIEMFENRLRKNQKGLNKWIQRQAISCYRLYDADLPEFAVAIDRYNDWVHVAEYAPPPSVDAELAQRRLASVVSVLPEVLSVEADKVVVKQRQRQRGQQQYQRHSESGDFIEVVEGQARLLVNLRDYLDSGLFLDHRVVRLEIARLARGKRFLNLFCYTASASVHAALGGAALTDSVDMSATYLDWARKNFSLNGFSENRHRLIRADVLEWLRDNTSSYDLIFLDPPTFSNSKKMQSVFDIQRDHCELIQQVMGRLDRDGLLIFSNNHRKFVLDASLSDHYAVEDKTQWSLDRDFQQRHKRIHQCWFIRHRSA